MDSMAILNTLHRLGVQTKRRGALYVALCPFHHDKDTPSLTIYPKTQSWFCFGNCESKGGDAISFVMKYKSCSYQEALDWLGNETVGKVSFNIKAKSKIVPPNIVLYYHSLLQDRSYFYARGFKDAIINSELWGWDGSRYCIPIWEGEPANSNCLGIRQRKTSKSNGPKYIGLKNMNPATVWGRYHCKSAKTIYGFAGEFDAALAVQDGLPAFSVVNGVNAFEQFPDNWPHDWFPNSENLIVIFDRGEEAIAGKFASVWNSYKGSMKARVFHWSWHNAILPLKPVKDYCNFRERFPFDKFKLLLEMQLGE